MERRNNLIDLTDQPLWKNLAAFRDPADLYRENAFGKLDYFHVFGTELLKDNGYTVVRFEFVPEENPYEDGPAQYLKLNIYARKMRNSRYDDSTPYCFVSFRPLRKASQEDMRMFNSGMQDVSIGFFRIRSAYPVVAGPVFWGFWEGAYADGQYLEPSGESLEWIRWAFAEKRRRREESRNTEYRVWTPEELDSLRDDAFGWDNFDDSDILGGW